MSNKDIVSSFEGARRRRHMPEMFKGALMNRIETIDLTMANIRMGIGSTCPEILAQNDYQTAIPTNTGQAAGSTALEAAVAPVQSQPVQTEYAAPGRTIMDDDSTTNPASVSRFNTYMTSPSPQAAAPVPAYSSEVQPQQPLSSQYTEAA